MPHPPPGGLDDYDAEERRRMRGLRVIDGGRREVMLPNGSVVDVRADPFVLQSGLSPKTEMQLVGSALNAVFACAMKGDYDTANGILAGVRDAITKMSKRKR